MADEVAGKPRRWCLKWLLGLVGLASTLGPSAASAYSDLEKARAQLDTRVLAARESLRTTDLPSGELTLPERVAQWINWPNWGNWGNWPNWNNWNNWPNWWNR